MKKWLRLLLEELFKPVTYKCNVCKDSGYHEVNIWYDEVITVECEYCKKQISKL
jgi:excinuclease UvrABC ATPase subunit